MYQIHRLMVERRGGLPVRLRKGAAFLLRFRRCGLRGRLLLRCTLLRYSIRLGLLCLGGIRRRVEHDHRQAGLFQHLGLRGHGRQQTVCPRLLTQSFQLGVLLPQCHHLPLTGVKPGLVTADLRIGSSKTAVQQLRLSGLAREPSPGFRFDLRHHFLHFLHPAQSAAVFTGSGGTITLHTAQHTGPAAAQPFGAQPDVVWYHLCSSRSRAQETTPPPGRFTL